MNLSLLSLAGEWYTTYKSMGVVGDCNIYPRGSFGLYERICNQDPSEFIEQNPSKSDPFLEVLDFVKTAMSINYGIACFGFLSWWINPHSNIRHILLIFSNIAILLTCVIMFQIGLGKATNVNEHIEKAYSFYASVVTCGLAIGILLTHVKRVATD
jgi:hypothetical protein